MSNTAYIVTDLGYGDAGKGTVTEYLSRTRPVHLVVRHNGGAQAGHNVVDPDGRHHTFAQFGSASFTRVPTYLSRHMVVHPGGLLVEARILEEKGVRAPMELLRIDEEALVITPYHQSLNRARELARGNARHGTCGVGVGETVSMSLRVPELNVNVGDVKRGGDSLRLLLSRVRDFLLAEGWRLARDAEGPDYLQPLREMEALSPREIVERWGEFRRQVEVVESDSYLRAELSRPGAVVFEGAQGVLLDEWYGFHPHTTWSKTTSENAEALLREHGHAGPVVRLGIVRAYATRHGQGPLPTEGSLRHPVREPHNDDHGWQGRFRTGAFDAVLTRYAVEATGGVAGVVLTHLDQVPEWRAALHYTTASETVPKVSRLVVHPRPPSRMATQNELSRWDLEEPLYSDDLNGEENICGAVESILDCPVLLGSRGPRARDKFERGVF